MLCALRRCSAAPVYRPRTISNSRIVMAQAAKVVSAPEASEICRAGAPYVDVRSPEEFAAGHAAGAAHVPWMFKGAAGMTPNPAFLDEFSAKFADKSAQLVVGCQSGRRSAAACEALTKLGYTNLVDVGTGYAGWQQAGLPVEQ